MTKTICDICGNLITDSRENWLVSIQSHVGEKALKYYQKKLRNNCWRRMLRLCQFYLSLYQRLKKAY